LLKKLPKNILPHNAKSDREEPEFDAREFHMIGEISAHFRRQQLGDARRSNGRVVRGVQLPVYFKVRAFAWFSRQHRTANYAIVDMANANLTFKNMN